MSMIKAELLKKSEASFSRDGMAFDPTSLSWRLSRDRVLSLSWVVNCLSGEILESYIKVLLFYAETKSAAHTVNINNHFRNFIQFNLKTDNPLKLITPDHVINYRSTLSSKHEYYLGVLRGFFNVWLKQGYLGVSPEVSSFFKEIRIKGNEKGKAIQTLCPHEGALSDLEYERLHQALTDAFEVDDISLENYTLIMLSIAMGRRPAQLSDLKISDLTEVTSSDGLRMFLLRIPRCKQRGALWREQFRDYALTPELGVLVKSHVQSIERRFTSQVAVQVNTKKLAIFPFWKRVGECENAHADELEMMLAGEDFHRRASSLSHSLKTIIRRLKIYSERTNEFLNVLPIRLRRTLATRAAREGYGKLMIAELLDHTDTQSAAFYIENVPEHLDAINRAVAEQLAPLAQAFAGVLVDREKDAERGDDLTSRVRSNVSYEGVGSCGSYGFCSALAPIACYTCRHFQPWLDAPHEEILDRLIYQRKEIKSRTGDMAMASVNDRTIFAITEVVRLCAKRKTKQIEA